MININNVQANLKSISTNTRVITANAEKKRRVQRKNTKTLASIFVYPVVMLSVSFISLGGVVRLCYIMDNIQHNRPLLSVPEQNSNKY